MQVVSGPVGQASACTIEAPAAARLDDEMKAFLAWFNAAADTDPVLKAALAHLWFVTIHPFDDGNGRIARAIADMALARSEGSPQRFYSMSAQIRHERNGLLRHPRSARRRRDLDITAWLAWFLACLGRAFDGAEDVLAGVLTKARFWERTLRAAFNDRQRDMLNRLLDGFEGKLTSSKWAKIEKCFADTRCATSTTSWNAASSRRTRAAGAARAIPWPKASDDVARMPSPDAGSPCKNRVVAGKLSA